MSKKCSVKYKKAPQAPRRFKSSYMFFSTEKHKSIRKELLEKGEVDDKLSTTEVAKLVSQAWKDLSEDEREVWEDMARKDKARYEMEKTMYKGPWKVPAKRRSQKDPNAPKRPMSAFLSFSNSKRGSVKEKYPNIGNAEVSRILAQLWKDASNEERKEHVDKEFKLRQEYKLAIAEWRKNSEIEMQAARKEREDQAMKAVLEGGKPVMFDEFDEYPSSAGGGGYPNPRGGHHCPPSGLQQAASGGHESMYLRSADVRGEVTTLEATPTQDSHHDDQPLHQHYQPYQQYQGNASSASYYPTSLLPPQSSTAAVPAAHAAQQQAFYPPHPAAAYYPQLHQQPYQYYTAHYDQNGEFNHHPRGPPPSQHYFYGTTPAMHYHVDHCDETAINQGRTALGDKPSFFTPPEASNHHAGRPGGTPAEIEQGDASQGIDRGEADRYYSDHYPYQYHPTGGSAAPPHFHHGAFQHHSSHHPYADLPEHNFPASPPIVQQQIGQSQTGLVTDLEHFPKENTAVAAGTRRALSSPRASPEGYYSPGEGNIMHDRRDSRTTATIRDGNPLQNQRHFTSRY